LALTEISLPIAPRGLATSFTQSETPIQYALSFKNRFINAAGGAEKRQGMQQLGNTVPGTPKLTGIHELVTDDGTATLFASSNGTIYSFDGTNYTQVFTGWDVNSPIRSKQFDDKLIFYNGVDRNIYTEDGITFRQLNAVVEAGVLAADTSAAGAKDGNVTDWVTNTFVVENDLLHNRTLDAYGVINTVTTAQAAHSIIGTAQATGLGIATVTARNQAPGDAYQILDLVELNVIDVDGVMDNTSTNTSGSTATTIKVNGTDFSTTEMKVGDFVRNTTRAAIAKVSAINASALTVTSVASQTAGDSLIFLKEAMPIAKDAHVHFGRYYQIDARDQKKVRISGPNNPEDMTNDAGTLDTSTFNFGALQPQGDIAIAMESFQRFFAIGGRENLYLYQGIDPIKASAGGSTSFDIIGLFPQGVVASEGMVSIGNDLIFLTPDGIQSAELGGDASQINRSNLSEAIKVTLRNLVQNTPDSQIQVLHYPRRSWFMLKIGSQIYVFNYTTNIGKDQIILEGSPGSLPQGGSWSLFDGKFARQNFYLVRDSGDLVCVGDGGKVYQFDIEGLYADDGEAYTTEYRTPWMDFTELSRRYHDVKIKEVKYIKPIFESGANTEYTIRLEGGLETESTDSITVGVSGGSGTIGTATLPFVIGGANAQNTKYSLRGSGEQFRLTFSTSDTNGPDVLSRYTLYVNYRGRR
jgi:hypothetical protein